FSAETAGINLRVKSVRIRAAAIAIHEMTFHLHVPELVDVNPSGDNLVVIVVGRQTGIGCRRIKGCERTGYGVRDRVARVIGPDLKPFGDPVSSGDVPAAHIGEAFRSAAEELLVAPVTPIL